DSLVNHGVNLLKDAINFAGSTVRDWRQNAPRRAPAPSAAFLTSSTCRAIQIDGRWMDNYCQPIIDLLSGTGIASHVFEVSDRGQYRVPRYSPSTYVQPWLNRYAVETVLARKRVSTEGFEAFSEVVAFLDREAGLTAASVRKIINRAAVVRAWADFF